MHDSTEQQLRKGLQSLSLSITEEQIQKLSAYLRLLIKWNKTYNLTAVRDEAEMVGKHLLDSLAVKPLLQQAHGEQTVIADVGTGAGLPGIPLAIVLPGWQFLLIDSNSKKTGFLQQAKTELTLSNVTIENSRAEQVSARVNGVISRAFASVAKMLEACEGLFDPDTVIWAMKAKLAQEELLEIPKSYRVSASHQLAVPGVAGDRCLLRIVREQPA